MGYVVIYTVVNNIVFVGVSENCQYAPKRHIYIYITQLYTHSDAYTAGGWFVANCHLKIPHFLTWIQTVTVAHHLKWWLTDSR